MNRPLWPALTRERNTGPARAGKWHLIRSGEARMVSHLYSSGGAVVGIDPSLTGTAVCVMSSPHDHVMHRFTSKPADGVHDRIERFGSLVEQICNVVCGGNVSLVVIEGYSFGSKGAGQLD